MNYEQNDHIEHYREVKIFFKEYIGEQLMTSFISYPDMKTKYPIEIIDLRHHSDLITPKKINYSWNMVVILRMQNFLRISNNN